MTPYLKPYTDLVAHKKNSTLWITLNRPEASNAYSVEMVSALVEVLKHADIDNSIRVIVIDWGREKFLCWRRYQGHER